VPRGASTCVPSNAARAASYGMPGVRIEDNAVAAVHEAAGEAVARARSGGGPSLVDAVAVGAPRTTSRSACPEGNLIAEAAVDKVDMEVPDPAAGTIHLLATEGDIVKQGTIVARID
jgi:biotin carboxyl carrier protein